MDDKYGLGALYVRVRGKNETLSTPSLGVIYQRYTWTIEREVVSTTPSFYCIAM